MKIRFHGAVNGQVTGSCTEFFYKRTDTRFLVDCGMVQGETHAAALNSRPFAFDPGTLKFVLLTHAHLDHCGLLPKLCREGFSGKVICTRATIEAAKAILHDAAGLPDSPYDRKDVGRVIFEAVDERPDFGLSRILPIDNDLFASFIRTAHLPGSVSVTLHWKNDDDDDYRQIVMSGDIGPNTKDNPYQSLLAGRQSPFGYPDYIVLESTYGDRPRDAKFADRELRLRELDATVKESVVKRSGPLVIPCFSMQRTQDILFDLYCLYGRPGKGSLFSRPLMTKSEFEAFVVGKPIRERQFESIRKAAEGRADVENLVSAFVEKERNGTETIKYVFAGGDDGLRDRLRRFLAENRVECPLVVHLESPLGRKITEVYRNRLKDRQKVKVGETVFRNRKLMEWLGVDTEEDVDRALDEVFGYADASRGDSGSIRVGGLTLHYGNSFEMPLDGGEIPTVVISSGGMCEGGPIVKLLPTALLRESVTVAVTGYMAKSSTGARMVEAMSLPADQRQGKLTFESANGTNGKAVGSLCEVDCVDVRARMADLRGYYSGHADLNGLCDFVLKVGDKDKVRQAPKPVRVILNHGAKKAMQRLKEEIESRSGKEGLREVSSVSCADAQKRWLDLDKGEFVDDYSMNDKVNMILDGQVNMMIMLSGLEERCERLEALIRKATGECPQ